MSGSTDRLEWLVGQLCEELYMAEYRVRDALREIVEELEARVDGEESLLDAEKLEQWRRDVVRELGRGVELVRAAVAEAEAQEAEAEEKVEEARARARALKEVSL